MKLNNKSFVFSFILVAMTLFQLANPSSVLAAGITVNTLVDEDTANGTCSLREAIIAANSDAAYNGCAAGAGNDVITFSVSGTIALGSTLPTITTSLSVDGGGLVTISGSNTARLFLVNSPATLNIAGLTLTNGYLGAGTGGGAIFTFTGTTLNITNSTFSNNSSGASTAGGGAIYNQGNLNITGSTFTQNNAAGSATDGGAILSIGASSSVTITDSTFYNNSAGVGPTYLNSVGGAISIRDSNGSNTITHLTLSNNTNENLYGALDIFNSTTTLGNSIIANSVTGVDCSKRGTGAITSSNNLIENDSLCGGVIVTTDPSLGPLQDNGGPTQTMAISSGSSAVDKIATPCAVGVDQRGVIRPQGASCDIGAYELDNLAPTVTIEQAAGQLDPTNASPINFTVVFSEAVSNFATGDVNFTGSTAAGTLIGTVTGGPTTYNVAVTGMTGTGTVVASTNAGVATDSAGNNNTASTSTDNTVTYDVTAPTVTIEQAVGQADPTSASPINFTVVFSKSVSNFATGDVSFTGSTATGILVGTVTGGPTTYNVAVTGMTGTGTVVASINAGVATDAAGNNNAASTSTDNIVTYDTTAPTVTIEQAAGQLDPTNASPINFTVVFSEAVSNFATGDVNFTGSTATGTLVGTVTGGPTTYNVAVTGMTGAGTVVASINAGVATDSAGNNNTASTSTDNTVTYNAIVLTATIDQAAAQPDPTNTSPINFTVVFNESVSDFATGDVSFTGSTVGGTLVGTVTGGPTTYNVAVTGMTGTGTVVASINAGVATDTLGNGNAASTSTDNTVTHDTTAPTVTIEQAVGQVDPTNASPINFTVVFSKSVSNFATGDVSFTGSTVGGTLVGTITGSGTTYNVAVTGMTGTGTVVASISAGVATDTLGNGNTSSTSIDNTVTYDSSRPIVTIGAPVPASTIVGPADFAVTITGATTINLTNANVTVTTTGTAAATTVTVANGTTATPTVTISGISGNGTISITIAAGIASDASGNTSLAASSPTPLLVDNAGPTVLFNSFTVPTDGATVPGGPTQLKVAFNEDVKNDSSAGAANNAANFILVGNGPNLTLDTVSCLLGVQTDDIQYPVNTATYTNNGGSGPFVSTLAINGGTPLPVGSYHLFVCGTTSIQDLVNNELNNGTVDTVINFTVVQATAVVPKTGFPMNTVTNLPVQPAGLTYASTDMWMEIPSLNVKMPIIGVPKTSAGWDVTWLDKSAGWLDGSAYPTWSGNSVITAHVWDALNKPGPFAHLKELKYGDQVKVHAFGQVYTYEIRETKTISPTNATAMLKHEDKSWLTLITCEGFQELTKDYASRRMVRAVLVSVTAEK